MKNKLVFSSELKKVKHYKQVITKIDSAYKKKHPLLAISRSIYSLPEIPGRHLLKRQAIPCSSENPTSQPYQMGGGTKRKGLLLDILFLITVRGSAFISFLPPSALFFHLISPHSKHCCNCKAARDSILYAPPSSHCI